MAYLHHQEGINLRQDLTLQIVLWLYFPKQSRTDQETRREQGFSPSTLASILHQLLLRASQIPLADILSNGSVVCRVK